VKALVGGSTREDIASRLADSYLKKFQTEEILSRYVPATAVKDKILRPAVKETRERYDAFGLPANQ
jgi:hypothetical protein